MGQTHPRALRSPKLNPQPQPYSGPRLLEKTAHKRFGESVATREQSERKEKATTLRQSLPLRGVFYSLPDDSVPTVRGAAVRPRRLALLTSARRDHPVSAILLNRADVGAHSSVRIARIARVALLAEFWFEHAVAADSLKGASRGTTVTRLVVSIVTLLARIELTNGPVHAVRVAAVFVETVARAPVSAAGATRAPVSTRCPSECTRAAIRAMRAVVALLVGIAHAISTNSIGGAIDVTRGIGSIVRTLIALLAGIEDPVAASDLGAIETTCGRIRRRIRVVVIALLTRIDHTVATTDELAAGRAV